MKFASKWEEQYRKLKLGKTLEEMTEMVGLPSKNGWERLEAGQHKLYYQKHIEAIMRMMK